MRFKISVFLIISFLFSGCLNDDSSKTKSNQEKPVAAKRKYMEKDLKIDSGIYRDEFKYEKSIKARRLFLELSSDPKNFVFSPLSLEAALILLSQNSKADSKEDILSFLELKDDELIPHIQGLLARLNSLKEGDEGNMANLVLASDRMIKKPGLADRLSEDLGAILRTVDFKGDNQRVIDELNEWIEKETKGKIKRLVDQLSRESLLVLSNAIYLKLSWMESFKENLFEKRDFYRSKDDKKSVEMMQKMGYMSYIENDSVQGVMVPFRSSEFTMWLFKPKKDLKDFKVAIMNMSFKDMFASYRSQRVVLKVPRFQIQNKLKLMEYLVANGLSRLTTSPNYDLGEFFQGKHDIILSEAIQGNFFNFDEKGIEAASATVLGMRAGSAPPTDEPIMLEFNKPFVFMVYHRMSGRVAFIGQVFDPK